MSKYIVLLAIFTVVFSCKEKTKKNRLAIELKAFYGQTVTFPEELKSASGQLPDFKDYPGSQNYKIIAYIDSAACTPCTLQTFTLWKNFTEKLEESNTRLIIILKSDRVREIQEILTYYDIDFPAFTDPEGHFRTVNRLPENPLLHTFLVDKNNRVAFVGSPIQNEKSWLLFQKTITQLNGNHGVLPPE